LTINLRNNIKALRSFLRLSFARFMLTNPAIISLRAYYAFREAKRVARWKARHPEAEALNRWR
jgi:hypothetical protein